MVVVPLGAWSDLATIGALSSFLLSTIFFTQLAVYFIVKVDLILRNLHHVRVAVSSWKNLDSTINYVDDRNSYDGMEFREEKYHLPATENVFKFRCDDRQRWGTGRMTTRNIHGQHFEKMVDSNSVNADENKTIFSSEKSAVVLAGKTHLTLRSFAWGLLEKCQSFEKFERQNWPFEKLSIVTLSCDYLFIPFFIMQGAKSLALKMKYWVNETVSVKQNKKVFSSSRHELRTAIARYQRGMKQLTIFEIDILFLGKKSAGFPSAGHLWGDSWIGVTHASNRIYVSSIKRAFIQQY